MGEDSVTDGAKGGSNPSSENAPMAHCQQFAG